jgi:hypothetical protein
MRPFLTSKDLWSFGLLRIFLKIWSDEYAFWHSFSRLGRFSLSMLLCQMNGAGGSIAIEDETVRSSSFVRILVFELIAGSSCWGGIILLASFIWGSLTSCIALAATSVFGVVCCGLSA